MSVRLAAAIGIAGALGALSRHYLESFVNRRVGDDFPWGTFVVNISGSFVLGLAVGIFARRLSVPMWAQAGVTVGFLGAYTTFSTFTLQIYRSTSTGHLLVAALNTIGSVAVGVLAVYAGILVTRGL